MSAPANPVVRFLELFGRAAADAPFDHTAAALATVNERCEPTVRVVLVRKFDDRGFVFFTNYDSRKGADVAQRRAGALCFYWPWLDEQVRADGAISKITPQESDEYFATRPRGSQIGAWASKQSEALRDRAELERRYFEFERQFEGQPVPRPEQWGGYRLRPDSIEFWRAGEYRLHDRWLYTRTASGWEMHMLYP